MQEPSTHPRPVQLHLAHSLGGGAAKWLADFIEADHERENLVLRSISHRHAAANGVALFRGLEERPLQVWTFREPISAAASRHPEYRRALEEIVAGHGVGGIIVSSLIGHSIEALETGLRTLFVTHDYFPYCPAINLYFGARCDSCDGARMRECATHNARFNPFADFTAEQRHEVRERFMEAVVRASVTVVTPTASVRRNLMALDTRFRAARFLTIPHGYGVLMTALSAPKDGSRLRVLVLGQMSIAKGVEILREALPAITAFADVWFLGAGELGSTLSGIPHVTVRNRYEPSELREVVAHIDPHVGVLASVVAETFSYALSELRMLGVPVAATRAGSFEDRIADGIDGWLFEPDAASLSTLLRTLDARREALEAVRQAMARETHRTARDMVAEYHEALPMEPLSGGGVAAIAHPLAPVVAEQAMALSDMWKEVKSLHLRLALARENADREQAHFRAGVAALEARQQLDARRTAQLTADLHSRERELADVRHLVGMQEAQMRRIFSSLSWRVLGPLRRMRRGGERIGLLLRCIAGAARDRRGIRRSAAHLYSAARSGGALGLKTALLAYGSLEGAARAWATYREQLRADVLPVLVKRVAAMTERPRISIVMATYNTAPAMLEAALDSVLAQIYPAWELCVADDASTDGRVGAVLREYAKRDARIRVHWGQENRGVAHASNRALEMATGEYVVLMDHDDALEEQALYRFAEAIVADGPDVLYSDEVIAAPDGETAHQVVYRPAFSPELLRSHPYIVHLVGFRAQLLRDLGGFDEALRISQDYDLILRATERATCVAHVPEPLYRWRTHRASAGHRMMDQVVEASTNILQGHLDRSGLHGTAGPGFGFNFYDIRYELRPGQRVLAIIPTHNHGELLRQCVESLRRTIHGEMLQVLVVDHQSDDPATLAYLRAAPGVDRVLRYEGDFNFSAINNFAVKAAGGGYTHYLFCNNDVEALEPGWLERMLELGQQGDIGIVGAKLLYGDRSTIQHAGVGVGLMERAEHYGKFMRMPREGVDPAYYGTFYVNREVSAVTAACMLVRADAFAEVGGFDEAIAVGFGDVDLCLRIGERGYRIVQCGSATLVHHESMTRGPNDRHPLDSARFEEKWQAALNAGDPYYNPGLSTRSTSWQPRNPLRCSVDICRRVVRIDREAVRQAVQASGDCG